MPEPAELSRVLAGSRTWLAGAGSEPSTPLKQTLQSLLGVWACERALVPEQTSSELREIAAAASTKLESAIGDGSFDAHAYDPKLLLVALHAFSQAGSDTGALRGFADSLAASFESLSRAPASHAGAAALLFELGYTRVSAPASVGASSDPDLDSLMLGGPVTVRVACSSVAAAAHFGARRVPGERFETLRLALPIILLQSLRSYDLDTAAMLLRASVYLRMHSSPRIEEAIWFFLEEQKPDGRFGYFGVETSALTQSGELDGFDAVLSVYLPITVTCAWALSDVLRPGSVLAARRRPRPVLEQRVLSHTN